MMHSLRAGRPESFNLSYQADHVLARVSDEVLVRDRGSTKVDVIATCHDEALSVSWSRPSTIERQGPGVVALTLDLIACSSSAVSSFDVDTFESSYCDQPFRTFFGTGFGIVGVNRSCALSGNRENAPFPFSTRIGTRPRQIPLACQMVWRSASICVHTSSKTSSHSPGRSETSCTEPLLPNR